MSKKVIRIAFVFSLVGLFSDCLTVINADAMYPMLHQAALLLSVQTMSVMNVACDLMLLVGAILYVRSAGRETRMIRFVLSIVLLSNALAIFPALIRPSFIRNQFQVYSEVAGWILYGVALIKNVLLVYFSHRTLRVLHEEKVLETVQSGTPEEPIFIQREASGQQRFVNVLIDWVVCALLLLPLGPVLVPAWMSWTVETLGERDAIILQVVVARIIYYILFEIILATTPGKFMTETRVMDADGDLATPGRIVKRTLSRFIPLEPVSLFWGSLWHDTISYTRVVREQPTGVAGARYLLIFPAIVVLEYVLLRMTPGL
jgi:uncharacterized RDD family membrane protein YckC